MKLGWDLILTTLSKTTRQIAVFVLSIVLARFLAKEAYGTYLHVQLIVNVAIWAFMLGLPHSIYYFLPKTGQKRKFILVTLALVSTISIFVAGLTLATFPALAQLLSNPSLETYMLVTACIILFSIPASIFEPLMISSERVRTFAATDFIFNICYFFVIFIPMLLGYGLLEIFYSLCAFHAIQATVVLGFSLIIAKQHNNSMDGTPYRIMDQFKYAAPIGLSQGIFELAKYGDKIIVSNFFNPATYAVYARGAMDIPLINIFNNTLDNLLMPKFVQIYQSNDTQALIKLWHQAMILTAAFMYPSFWFLEYTADLLIPALYSDKYMDSVIIFQIYTCTMLFRVSTYNVIIRVIGKTGIMAWVAGIGELLNIMMTIFFIKLLGLQGAPLSTALGIGVVVFGYLLAISRELNIQLNDILPWQRLGSILIYSGIPIFALMPIRWLGLGYWPTLGLMMITYSFIFWLLIRFFSVLQEHEKEMIRNMLPKSMQCFI